MHLDIPTFSRFRSSLFILWAVAVLGTYPSQAQTGNKILFDATRAEMANNADWVVDADVFNIGAGTGGAMQTGRGSESNPQMIPTPGQSGLTATTPETFWKGALSSWGVAAAKAGLAVETLPYNGRLTYQDNTNAQDLSHYQVYVLDEPNIAFTSTEKTAIIRWVQDGGGLFIISDHNGSDRNNDGIDSPGVLNDLLTDNGVQANPFGFSYDLLSFSELSSGYLTLAHNAVLNGPYGHPAQINISSGTSMTISPTANSTVQALCFRNSASHTGNTGALVVRAGFGQGRVVGMADSSPMDDGTGDTGDQLYTGWAGEANGDHARVVMNATLWLAGLTSDSVTVATRPLRRNPTTQLAFYPNPSHGAFEVIAPEEIMQVRLYDLLGNAMLNVPVAASSPAVVDPRGLSGGIYIVKASGVSGQVFVGRVMVGR